MVFDRVETWPMTTPAVLPGAEPMSHEGTTDVGVLVLHGFTGNPSSMRGLAEAMVAVGHHVEMPRLPGHGTTIDDMLDTRWADWTAEVAAAHARLAGRVDTVVVMGLSMGGSLTLWSGLTLPGVVGLVCVNPATMAQPAEVVEMISEMVADGTEIAPAIGGDIADPDAVEIAYDGVPLRAMLSLMNDGLHPDDRSLRRAHDAAVADHLTPGPCGRAGQQRTPCSHVRRRRRARVARAQLSRGDSGLRRRRHQPARAGEFVARVTAG